MPVFCYPGKHWWKSSGKERNSDILSMMMTSKATLPPTRHLSAYKYFTSHTQSKHDHKYEFFCFISFVKSYRTIKNKHQITAQKHIVKKKNILQIKI